MDVLTSTTESLAAMARISAHETIPLHTASNLALALSITSKPRKVILLAKPSFSARLFGVESINTDPSQPY